jgi:hypothetical protein
MQDTPDRDSRSPPSSGGTITRAESGPGNRTAQPSLTSGFGAVIEKEYELQSATEGSFGQVSGEHPIELDRILRDQHSRVGANIALLEQRYERPPSPTCFVNWQDRSRPFITPGHARRAETELLPGLIALHTKLLSDIEALIDCAPDGQRGELILTAISRNHEEMAWMLTALLREDETVVPFPDNVASHEKGSSSAEESWDNEGGPCMREISHID